MKFKNGLIAALAAMMLGGFSVPQVSVPLAAEDYPSKEVTIIVPRAPGGGSDNIARILQPTLEQKLGVPVIIENRPDASAVLGAELVARAAPDGYTVYLSDNAFYQNPAVIGELPYDPINDFDGVTRLARGPVVLIVHPDVPATNADELVEYAKTNPDTVTYSTGGIGTSTHLAGVQFNLAADTDIVHVPYASSGPALNALLGGHVTMQMGGLSSARPHIEEGTVRAIGVTGSSRDPSMPDIPTLEEQGYDVSITSVWGILAPANTPLEVREKLADGVRETMNEPDVSERLAQAGYHIVASTPEEHEAEKREMIDYWLEVAKEIDLSE